MVKKVSNNKIPKVLEERLLLNEEHRKILKAMEELSPRDTGYLFIPGANGRDVPTVDTIAEEVKMPAEKVRARIKEVKKFWHVPDKLPTGNGWLNEEEALVSALTNQHKLRWDNEIKDYRVPRIHIYTAELGTGTLYTRNKAFEGEKIWRSAIGLDEVLNSYTLQGGVMPQIISMYGKQKAERAALVGLTKTGKEYSADDLEQLKGYLELAQKKDLSAKQIKSLENFVVNTLDNMEEAARSVAYEIKPLIEGIPEHVPIHMFMSYNDDFNMDELGDLLIASMRLVRKKAKEAELRIPELEGDIAYDKERIAQQLVNIEVADYILKNKYQLKDNGRFLKNKKLRSTIEEKLFYEGSKKKKASPGLKEFKEKLMKDYLDLVGKSEEGPKWLERQFKDSFEDAKKRFFGVKAVNELSVIEDRKKADREKTESIKKDIKAKRSTIEELRTYEKALHAEESERHAWFTRKIAINPTECKAHILLKKEQYKDVIKKYFIGTLEELLGRTPNIKLHMDREISVYVPDPATLLGKNEYSDQKLYGTIITSIPRTNRQRSNEPLLDSLSELQKKHESAIASRIKLKKERPKTVKEFEKRHNTAYSDVLVTSWGADGQRVMPKFVIAPTRVEGKYRKETEIAVYLKCTTRHDTKKLSDLAKRGNHGTWEMKRVDKGGPTTGNTIQIYHPDGSQEWFSVDDQHYEKIADQYGGRVSEIEAKIARAKTSKTRTKWKEELKKLYGEIGTEFRNILLANDFHFGASNFPGRPTNVDYIRSSQLIVLQTYGLGNIDAVVGTEFLHGNMQIQSYGYDSKREGPMVTDSNTLNTKMRVLKREMKKAGLKPDKAMDHLIELVDEHEYASTKFKSNDQLQLFKNIAKPVFEELLANGTIHYFGSGNHHNQSIKGFDEATTIAQLFDEKYMVLDQIRVIPAHGQSYSNHPISLPGKNGKEINAVLSHKMWHGRTEISKLADQAVGQKEDALIYLTADRHQPGVAMERERYFVLDCGKQTTMDYVANIGKASSVRGAMVMSYSPDRDLIYSTRFFLDNVVDKVIDWQHRSGILETNTSIIKNGLIESYKK